MKWLTAPRCDVASLVEIGRGPNSRVLHWLDPETGSERAIKEIQMYGFGNNVAAFDREAAVVFEEPHPNIVPLRCAATDRKTITLEMEFFRRGSLAAGIAIAPLPLARSLRIAGEVLAGVGHIHQKGFVHLDLTPTNVLISDADVAMVSDFAQARECVNGAITLRSAYSFSVPPEVLRGGLATPASDVFQVGLLVYRALNGDPFFRAQLPTDDVSAVRQIVAGKFPDRSKFMPHVPESLRAILRRALNVDPSLRYQSAADAAAAFGSVSICNDWQALISDSATTWYLDRGRGRRVEVVMQLEEKGWCAGVLTVGPGDGRSAGRRAFWRAGLSRSEATSHLRRIFKIWDKRRTAALAPARWAHVPGAPDRPGRRTAFPVHFIA